MKESAPKDALSLLLRTHTRMDIRVSSRSTYHAVPSSEVACYDSRNTFCGK